MLNCSRLICTMSVISIVTLSTVTHAKDSLMIEGLSYIDKTPIQVDIQDGIIQGIRAKSKLSKPTQEPLYIAPGLIDNQVNGYASVSFGFGGGALTVEGIRKATEALWREGVTTYFPTLTTNRHDILLANFATLARAVKDPELARSIPGYHLEGPYISPIDGYRGAHPLQYVRLPDWQEFMAYYKAADGKIIQVSVAPELDGAMDFIRRCRALGIKVALAHHNGSAAVIKQAVDEGAIVATHLGNGCANLINRHDNPLWPQLADDRLYASIICDGFHLRPEEIQVFVKAKGVDRILVTSDVTRFAGMTPGIYNTDDGKTIELTVDGMIRYPAQQVLAGSASPMTKGVGHIMRVTGCSLEQAFHMASRNQARVYGLTDRGELETGKRADLIVFALEDFTVKIRQTYVAGRLVYSANEADAQ
ncbi:MAG: amidohydrolase family protein [Phycisphaerae bacterium]|nr:amidohydrolase family protein [Phycisphaerae bacterium]